MPLDELPRDQRTCENCEFKHDYPCGEAGPPCLGWSPTRTALLARADAALAEKDKRIAEQDIILNAIRDIVPRSSPHTRLDEVVRKRIAEQEQCDQCHGTGALTSFGEHCGPIPCPCGDGTMRGLIADMRRGLQVRLEKIAELEAACACPALELFKDGVCQPLRDERLRAEKAERERDRWQRDYTAVADGLGFANRSPEHGPGVEVAAPDVIVAAMRERESKANMADDLERERDEARAMLAEGSGTAGPVEVPHKRIGDAQSKSVWLLQDERHDTVRGVFSTEERARRAQAISGGDVVEFTVDEPAGIADNTLKG